MTNHDTFVTVLQNEHLEGKPGNHLEQWIKPELIEWLKTEKMKFQTMRQLSDLRIVLVIHNEDHAALARLTWGFTYE
jgi:hypothetical protein